MSRVNVKDGSIAARVRFRAAATDKAGVAYATSSDPGGTTWGERGNATYVQNKVMVSTLGVNAQADTELKAELFGEVRLNFVSDTLPLERFADSARLALLQRNARWSATKQAAEQSPTMPGVTPPTSPPSGTA
jgi:hypothetical protein